MGGIDPTSGRPGGAEGTDRTAGAEVASSGTGPGVLDASGRPTAVLPLSQLLALSVYWLGISGIFAGLAAILAGRLEYQALVPAGTEGGALFRMEILGALIAVLVQPTIGTISDHTTSRWGRRKPYIAIGATLDVVFLAGIATSSTVLAIAVFVILLQLSSNFAQGPFQGYVPDLVPGPQVGLASALVGLCQILGQVGGFVIGSIGIATGQFAVATVGLGLIELATALVVLANVREDKVARPRNGRSWLTIARDAWATDVLRERSFLWLVGSRLLVLMAGSVLLNLAPFYLARTFGLDREAAGFALAALIGSIALAVVVAVVPAAKASDRVGRKPVIWASCAVGASGLAICAIAPTVPVALAGAAAVGLAMGIFLAVDWALITEIIPKAASGRYMGISNVATASAGVLAVALGGTLMDLVGGPARLGEGPRAALAFGVACYAIGALLLRPVGEPGRGRATAAAVAADAAP